MEIFFAKPHYIWLLAPIPLFALALLFSLIGLKKEIRKLISFHSLEFFFKKSSFTSKYLRKNFLVFLLRAGVYAFIALAIAGPVIYYYGESREPSVVIAIDVSGSMLAEDIKPNRLDAVKETMNVFLERLPFRSKVAILSFSGNAYIERELSDKEGIKDSLENIEISNIAGTSIGAVLKTAANILKEERKPKLVVLISDGTENILSEEALNEIVDNINKEHITVNVIGIGQIQGAYLPGTDLLSTLNEPLLKDIAKRTDGVYVRAETRQSLVRAYDSVYSTKLNIPIRLDFVFIMIALLLLIIDYIFVRLA